MFVRACVGRGSGTSSVRDERWGLASCVVGEEEPLCLWAYLQHRRVADSSVRFQFMDSLCKHNSSDIRRAQIRPYVTWTEVWLAQPSQMDEMPLSVACPILLPLHSLTPVHILTEQSTILYISLCVDFLSPHSLQRRTNRILKPVPDKTSPITIPAKIP